MLYRRAAARLVASPLSTAFAVLSVAAGVAVTTAVYSVVDALMLAGTDVSEPATLAVVVSPSIGDVRRTALSRQGL